MTCRLDQPSDDVMMTDGDKVALTKLTASSRRPRSVSCYGAELAVS
jgi:hypothetical protein